MPVATPSLRILVAIDTIGVGGGAEQLMLTLLPAINAIGHEAEIVALSDWTPDLGPDFAARGVKTHFLHTGGKLAFLQRVTRLRTLLRAGRYDLLWSHSRQSSMAGAIALTGMELPHVVTLHSEGHAGVGRLPLRARLTTALEGHLLARPIKIAVSKAVARDYEAFFGWSDIDVISNCFDPSDLPPPIDAAGLAEARARFGVAPDEFLLITPARFVAKKGYPILIDALRILKRDRGWSPSVHAFGHGPLKEEIARTADRAAVSLTVHGLVRHDVLFRFIQAANGVVLPSLREPFGIAALEAMALGAPLIASSVDGLKEIIEGRDCALEVEPGNAAALADAIWDLKQKPDSAAARVARASLIAQMYTPGAMAREWNELFLGMA